MTTEDDDVESIVLEPVGESSGSGSTCDDEELEKIVVEDILQQPTMICIVPL